MARPSLSPMTFSDFERPREQRSWRWLLRKTLRLPFTLLHLVVRAIVRLFTTDLSGGDLRKTLPARAVLLGIMMKLAWMPPAVLVACGWVVYRQTHGPASSAAAVGQVARITSAFNERVKIVSKDSVILSGVWVPAFKPQDVITQGDALLRRREAAVVLVHDHGYDASQMLSQAALLHEMGLHVLVLETRGSGHSEQTARTYGRLERLDVAAAVDYVAARPTVDTARIAVWAVGTGAEAARSAPSNVPIALLIAEQRGVESDARDIDVRFVPPHEAYDPLRPVCRWLFDVIFAGGAPPATSNKPGRVLELSSGEMHTALQELNNLASEALLVHGGH